MKEYWSELTSGEKTKLILKILLGLLVLIFAVQNWKSTSINLVFFEMSLPLTILIVLCLGAGFAFSSVFDYRKFKMKNKEITELRSKIVNLTATNSLAESNEKNANANATEN